jgi:hypothetical protein
MKDTIKMPSNTTGRFSFRIVAVISAISGLVAVFHNLPLVPSSYIEGDRNASAKDGSLSKLIETSFHVPDREHVLESLPNHPEENSDGKIMRYLRQSQNERKYVDEGSVGGTNKSGGSGDDNRALQSGGGDDGDDDDGDSVSSDGDDDDSKDSDDIRVLQSVGGDDDDDGGSVSSDGDDDDSKDSDDNRVLQSGGGDDDDDDDDGDVVSSDGDDDNSKDSDDNRVLKKGE